jgi:hypothetical protein
VGLSWQQRPPGSENQVPLSQRTSMGGTPPGDVTGGADCLAVLHEVSEERARQRAAEDALDRAYWRMAKGVMSPKVLAACLLVAAVAVPSVIADQQPPPGQAGAVELMPYHFDTRERPTLTDRDGKWLPVHRSAATHSTHQTRA